MIQYIKRSIPGAVLLSLLILVVFRTIYHVAVHPVFPWYGHLLSLLLIIGTGAILSFLNDRYDLLPERTQWIMVTYVWLVSCCPQTYSELRATAASLLVAAAAFMLIYSAYTTETRSGPFLCSFFVTCAGLLFFPSYFLLIPCIVSFIRFAKVLVKDMLAFLGGIAVPFFLLSALLWFLDRDVGYFWSQLGKNFTLWDPAGAFSSFTIAQTVTVAVLTLLVVLSLFVRLLRKDAATTVNVSRFYSSLLWYVIFSAAIMIVYPVFAPGFILILMIPVSILITSLFSEKRLFGFKIWLALLILSTLGHWLTFIFPV
ncbi:MAG TPA: hypothetical protein PKU85_03175 [Bacteroidales bacterium]|nr:hypothetical protein [Bacteroidales bacterium]HPW78971.1 hypothetical protein [Bacteroidales bacterium]HQB56434.1 hypothetical protein [Bacteroidales bacterium]